MNSRKKDGFLEGLKAVFKGPKSAHVPPPGSPRDSNAERRHSETQELSSTIGRVGRPGDVAWAQLGEALRMLEGGVNLCPPLKSALDGVISCLEFVKAAVKNREDFGELAEEFRVLVDSLNEYAGELGLEGNDGSIARIACSIKAEAAHINEQRDHGQVRRAIAGLDRDDMVRRYRRIEALFQQMQNDINLRSWKTADKQYKMSLLERLSPADDAQYNSSYSTTVKRHGCTAETRQKVQKDIRDWVQDPNGASIYWMNGMAGTGKTTIAYSLCEWLEENKLLGASFFCSRGSAPCCNVNMILPTIAFQLARYSPAFKSVLCKVIEHDPAVGKLNVIRQFERLIRDPLLEVKHAIPDGVVVVIDALEECEDRHAVRLILETLLRLVADLPLKFFLANRPDSMVRDHVQAPGGFTPLVLHLHDIEESMVEDDIRKYLWEMLRSISPVPSESQINQLAKQCGKLFIYAATVVRYIIPDRGHFNSGARLNAMLKADLATTGGARRHIYKGLDELYKGILSTALEEPMEANEIEAVRLVLQTVISVKEPLTIQALALLLSLDELQVATALGSLQSVLHVSKSTGLVSTLHASFSDYMLDQSRSGELYCSVPQHNQVLAECCFRLMETQLGFNVCNLESSFMYDRDVHNIEQRIQSTISPALSYACQYWADHLRLSDGSALLQEMLQEFLLHRLLFWMEILNLKGFIGNSVPILTQALNWLSMHAVSGCILTHVADARNFATIFAANSCSSSTCHLYISAMALCSRGSSVFQNYGTHIVGGVAIEGTIIEDRRESALATWTAGSGVNTVAISPEGKYVAAGLSDGSIWVRDGYTGEIISGPFNGREWTVYSLAFSPRSPHIACSLDETIRVWDAINGQLVAGPFRGHAWTVNSVAFSHEGTRIVSGSRDCEIRVWNLSGGEHIGPFKGHTESVHSVAFSPDDTRIVSGSGDCTVRVWDSRTGNQIADPFRGHKSAVNSVVFAPGGGRIASGSSDGTVRVWDAHAATLTVDPFQRHMDSVNSVAFSFEGRRIVSGSSDGMIWIWDSWTGDSVAGPFRGHTATVTSVVFSSDGTRVVSGSWDRTVQVWNAAPRNITNSAPQGHTDSIYSAMFSPDGSRVVSGSRDGTIRVWCASTGNTITAISSFGRMKGEPIPITSVAFSPNGNKIASGSRDALIRVWDAHTGELTIPPLHGHRGAIESVAFSPEGARIISGSADQSVRVWDVDTGELIIPPLQGHEGVVESVVVSPDGARIVSGASDRTIRVWDAVAGNLIVDPLRGHRGPVNSVAFSPDGARIASGSQDKTIRIWDSRDGALVMNPITGHELGVYSVAFSPDGTRIVSGSDDQTIQIWDACTGDFIAGIFDRHTDAVNSVAFSPDGSCILSCSNDKTIRFWDARDVEPPLTTNSSSGDIGEQRDSSEYSNEHRNASIGYDGASGPVIDDMAIHQQNEQPHGLDGDWTFNSDGWVTNDADLLFWVPPNLHPSLPLHPEVVTIFPYGSIAVDYLNLLLGKRWSGCYISR